MRFQSALNDCHRLLFVHVRVLRARLSAFNDVERDDEVVASVYRRKVVVGSRLVPCHPRTADSALKDARPLFKRAFELLGEVELDVGVRSGTDQREQKAVESLLHHLEDGTETVRIKRAGVVLCACVGLSRCMPYKRRVDVISRRDIFTAELLRLCELRLLGVELIRLYFHAVFEQRHLAGVCSAFAPRFAESCREPCPLFVIPRLHVLRTCDVGVESARTRPDFRAEPVRLNLLAECLSQCRDGRLTSARIAWRIHAERNELVLVERDAAVAVRRNYQLTRCVVRPALLLSDPLGRNHAELIARFAVGIGKQPEERLAHEQVFRHKAVDELVGGLVAVRLPEEPCRRTVSVSAPLRFAVSDINLERELCHAVSEERHHRVKVRLRLIEPPCRQPFNVRDDARLKCDFICGAFSAAE